MSDTRRHEAGLRRQRVFINSLDHIEHHANNPDTLRFRLPKTLENAVRLDLVNYDIPYAPTILADWLISNQPTPPATFEAFDFLKNLYRREGPQTYSPASLSVAYTLSDGSLYAVEMNVIDVITESTFRENTDDPGNKSYVVHFIMTSTIPTSHLDDIGISFTEVTGRIQSQNPTYSDTYDLTGSPGDGIWFTVNKHFNKSFVLDVDVQHGIPWILSTRIRAVGVAEHDVFFRGDVVRLDGADYRVRHTVVYDQDFDGTEFFDNLIPIPTITNDISEITRSTFHIFQPNVGQQTQLKPPDRMEASYGFMPVDISTMELRFRQLSGGIHYFPFDVGASQSLGSLITNRAARIFRPWTLTFDVWYYDTNIERMKATNWKTIDPE